ncbi:MAG: nucleotidyltransferase domain-containing protein [Candidatus Thermoplasmatota archaeon]
MVEKFKTELLKLHGESILSSILFDSVARKEAEETSDIDLLVVAKSNRLKVMEDATSIAFSQLLKYKRYLSVK